MTQVASQPAAYAADDLRAFGAALFRKAGLDGDKPEVSAAVLVEADLMGHTTHGLALAPRYIQEGPRETGVPNIVTAVLASYRGYDTLGETTVVFTAGVGVIALLRRLRRPEKS